MAKSPVNKKLLTYGVVAIVAAGIWIATEPAPVRSSSGPKKPPARRSATKTAVMFTEEDFKAKFPDLNMPAKNVFRPLVIPAATGSAGVAALAPNEIPKDFSDNKNMWTYTGTAIVDGVPMALVENSATGEGEFIKVGQRWKNATVRKITPIILVMEGPNGKVRTMELLKEIGDGEEPTIAGMEVRPVTPNLAGPLGGRATTENANGNGIAAQENRNDQNITSD